MLAGVTSRWKQVVGYQFTGTSFDARFLRKGIENIMSKDQSMGLQIDAVVSDMGGQNQAFWRLNNIHAGRDSVIQNSAPHTSDPIRKQYQYQSRCSTYFKKCR
jgi:hypothetical protein